MSNKTRHKTVKRPHFYLGGLLLLILIGAACSQEATPQAAAPTTESIIIGGEPAAEADETAPLTAQEPTATPLPMPTLTPTPALAGTVNGQPILLERYETELLRYEQGQAALGLAVEENYRTRVFLSLVEQVVIEQAAAERGIAITPQMVQERVDQLILEAGGQENFAAWLEANQISQDDFVLALQAEMLTEALVAEITSDVPTAVEQVRALHIEVADATLAQSLVEQARNGGNFMDLARANSINPSAQVGGDLGYFYQGSLFVPELEGPAFSLQPGETSEVISVASNTGTTFHILQVVERDPARPLTPDQRFFLLRQRFEQWLSERLAQAEVVRIVE
ncbi:MAG: peptidylprolyl isomerase [Ardenticatenaceae bacterium]|nr:peptidylprolyl isomerase [Ardenticatenaceae bacterium]